MMTDPIADMLTRIRNAALARHDRTEIPASKLKAAVAEILKSEGYIADVRERTTMTEARRRSSRSCSSTGAIGRARSTASAASRAPVAACTCATTASRRSFSGLGISILSTSRGVMSDRDARRLKLGGELLCEVW
jgi:small subunit ribosomal protein S8